MSCRRGSVSLNATQLVVVLRWAIEHGDSEIAWELLAAVERVLEHCGDGRRG